MAHDYSPFCLLWSLKPEKHPLSPIGETVYDPLPILLWHFPCQNPVPLRILLPELQLCLFKLFFKPLNPGPINNHHILHRRCTPPCSQAIRTSLQRKGVASPASLPSPTDLTERKSGQGNPRPPL